MQWSGSSALSCYELTVNNLYCNNITLVGGRCEGRGEESVWFNSRTGHARAL